MKTTRTTQRPSFVTNQSLPFAIAAVAAPVVLLLGSLSLLRTPSPSVSASAIVPGPHHVVVDGAAGSQLAAQHPWATAAPAALNPLSFVSVDGATASQLAAAHPWVNAGAGPDAQSLLVPGYVSVDSATASGLAAEHPWTSPVPAPVVTRDPALTWTRYAYVSVDGAAASRLAAEYPWTSRAP